MKNNAPTENPETLASRIIEYWTNYAAQRKAQGERTIYAVRRITPKGMIALQAVNAL